MAKQEKQIGFWGYLFRGIREIHRLNKYKRTLEKQVFSTDYIAEVIARYTHRYAEPITIVIEDRTGKKMYMSTHTGREVQDELGDIMEHLNDDAAVNAFVSKLRR